MEHREIMIKRIKEMGLSLKDVYERKNAYLKAIHDKDYNKSLVYVEDLGLTQYWASNRRNVGSPVFDKISIYTVFKFYINLGIVFIDSNKKYYAMEEVEQLLSDRYKTKL